MWYKDGNEFNGEQAIRNNEKGKSLPRLLKEDTILGLGYSRVVEGVKPSITAVQTLQRIPASLVDGVPTSTWQVNDMFADTHEILDIDGVTVLYPAMTKLEHEAAYLAELQANAVETTIEHFKSLYMGVVNAKLKMLDYDSLATVKLWENDATFGTEATQILDWYKAIINLNYTILNDVQSATRTMPTDEEYLAEINGIEF